MTQSAHEQAPRISQVLPSVKCSSCGQPVPLADLGDHVCPPLPPPSLLSLQKPPMSPRSVTALLPQRLQTRSDARSSCSEKLSEDGERVLTPSRDPFQRLPPDISTTPTNIPLPKTPPSIPPDRPQHTPPPDRISTPARDAIPQALQRVRTPSNVSRRPTPPSPARALFPLQFGESAVPARPAVLSPARRDNLPPLQQPPLTPRSPFPNHASSSGTPVPTMRHHASFERFRTSSTVSASRPSTDKIRQSLDKIRPSLDARRPSLEPHHTPTEQKPPLPLKVHFAKSPRTGVPSPAPGTVPFPVLPPPLSVRQPPPPLSLVHARPRPLDRDIDTKTGGEAGMAGVGRRGFAAAARAAMFAASLPPTHPPPGDTHRGNVLQYLDSNSAIGNVMRGKFSFDPRALCLTVYAAAITPPLSPNSAHTPSPVSPFPTSPISIGTSTNGQHPRLPSPHDAMFQHSPVSASENKALPAPYSPGVRIASPSPSPSPIPNPFERRVSGETVSQSPMPSDTLPLPFFDVLKPELDPENESDDESVYTMSLRKDDDAPLSPAAGLAYTQDSDDDTPVVMPLDIRKSRDRRPSRQASAASSSKSAIPTSSAATTFLCPVHSRSASSATQTTTKSLGALARAMETLIEEGASVSVLASGSVLASIGGSASNRSAGKPSRSNTVPGPASPEQKPPKLPMRSHTSPSHPHVHSERVGVTGEVARIRNRGSIKRKDRICAGCMSRIEDGRWIQMDGGNVLCERCWKNMYLPKCRRCNLPIEKQAVSSRDGQLKGKYHKDCFNCHACQKSFPDKEFYVFDGKPFCAYHYHEANNSLCGAPCCGQPIEGPCAVTHSGKRYHPEHLLCEFEDGCQERLEEYWEVDGQMLCERHAALISSRDGSGTRGNDPAGSMQMTRAPGTDEGRMMKRMTRFIDLGPGGDDLDIR